MSEDQFTKLFKYMEKRFGAVDQQFELARQDRVELLGAVAELGGQLRPGRLVSKNHPTNGWFFA